MALTQTQQVLETIQRSERPLLCIPSGGGADAYASAFGLARVLKKLEKEPVIAAADGPSPKQLTFLEEHKDVQSVIPDLKRFIIEIDASKIPPKELRYERKGDKLYIYLSPKTGNWTSKDVTLNESGYRYDLIITVGAPDLESCKHLFLENTDFFYHTPIINIDHTPENEHYGQINIVDMTASSCGEVCYDLVHSIEDQLVDSQAATAFLTGMMSKTKSFKANTVTPKTLKTASLLMARGAERERIVQELFQTRTVKTLRLWGRALARLKDAPPERLVWSLLSAQDFMHAGSKEEDLPDVIDELISSSPEAKVVALIFEDKEHETRAIVRTERPLDAISLCAPFNASGTRETVHLHFPKQSIVEVEETLIKHLKQELKPLT